MYLKSIQIKNYRNFMDTKISFQEGINILIGPNNSGKTNLLKAINLLSKDSSNIEIHDFNKNELYYNWQNYKEIPPVVEIIYDIEHSIDLNIPDDGILKLKNFIIYDSNADIIKNGDEEIYKINATIMLRYEMDKSFIQDYTQHMNKIKNYGDFIEEFEKIIKNYSSNYYNVTSEHIVNKSEIKNIFNIDYIQANREPNNIFPAIKKYVREEIEEKIGEISIQQELTKLLGNKLEELVNDIKVKISKDEKKIGINNSKSSMLPNFSFNSSIENYLKFILKDDDLNYEIPIDNNGLGYNNLIQIYSIIKFKMNKDNNLLLIEEPEAHLHPAMQYKLLKYLSELNEKDNEFIKNQVFITTHSSNITAASNLDDMISIHYQRNLSDHVFNVEAYNLKEKFINEEGAKKHLAKFLDVTRSDMLFTDKIILVEGLAEKLLLPSFAKKLGFDFDLINDHISIVEVGGINFRYFWPLFINTKYRVVCFRDCDYKYILNGILDIEKYKKFIEEEIEEIKEVKKKDYKNIMIMTQKKYGSTFENELFIENFSNKKIISQLCNFVFPETLKEFINIKNLNINYWISNIENIDRKNTREMIKNISEPYFNAFQNSKDVEKKVIYEKLFFANLFLKYASNKKGDLALSILMDNEIVESIKIPDYIKEGLEWLQK